MDHFVINVSCSSIHCSPKVTCYERANLLALLYAMFLLFLSLSPGVLGQVWYSIVSIPDLCLIIYFETLKV